MEKGYLPGLRKESFLIVVPTGPSPESPQLAAPELTGECVRSIVEFFLLEVGFAALTALVYRATSVSRLGTLSASLPPDRSSAGSASRKRDIASVTLTGDGAFSFFPVSVRSLGALEGLPTRPSGRVWRGASLDALAEGMAPLACSPSAESAPESPHNACSQNTRVTHQHRTAPASRLCTTV